MSKSPKHAFTITINVAASTREHCVILATEIAGLCEIYTEETGVETFGSLAVDGCACDACVANAPTERAPASGTVWS